MKLSLKFSTVILLLILFLQNSYSQQNMNGWYWINGQPQSNTLNWVEIIDATHYYAVGESGTFMKSSDGGDTWLINSDAGVLDPSFNSGGTLRLYSAWFFDVNTGYAAGQSVSGDGGYIRRTTNGGESFASIGLGIPSGLSRVYDIYFINANTGYICGNNVVKAMKTTDGGLNWTLMPNLPSAAYDYDCVYAIDENNILLGLNSQGLYRKIVRTTNGGVNWIDQDLPGSSIYGVEDILFQNANTGFVCASGSGGNPAYFAYTTNAGANWTQAVYPNNSYGLKDLEIVGSTVYTLGDYQNYYYTTNLGVTWGSVNFSDPSNMNQPYTGIVYSFDLIGSDAIVVGLNGKINVSNDSGATWRNKNYAVGNSEYGFSSIYALPGTNKVWAGSNGGGRILYSTNRGTNWTLSQTSASAAFYQFDMMNSNTGYAAGGILNPGFGYCYKTTNGGVNWNQTAPLPSPGMPRYSLSFINENTGWIFGGYPFGSTNQICKTTDGGATWVNQLPNPATTLTFGSGDMADANTGYCLSGGVFKTTNGGTNWNMLNTLPTNLGWNKVKAFSATTLFIGGNQRIYKSFNGGLTWDSALIPESASFFNMDWVDLNHGTVVGAAGYTAKTTNGGLTWTERNPGSSSLTGVSMASKDTVFAASDRNVWGAMFRLYDNTPTITTVNVKVGIEGFWNGTVQVRDTVKCHLRNSVSPYAEVEVVEAYLDNQGNGTFNFKNVPSGSYYLEITHRNSVETWSGLPQNLTLGGVNNYDFTTSASQAFGNNLILKSSRYCNYSGDVNQNGDINLADVVDTYNASSSFLGGYVPTDVNGDNTVDLGDITYVYNNARSFVAKIAP